MDQKIANNRRGLADKVMYQIFLRAYTARGTLQAAAQTLPFLAEMGVDIVYLTPVAVHDRDADPATWSPRQRKAGTNCPSSPYRLSDYMHVEPEYGTDEDLTAFADAAHQCGLRVMVDLVYLHCGRNAVFLQEHPTFVHRKPDGSVEIGPWNMPLLNFDEPELRAYLIDNMRMYVREHGIDGFRCDVGDHVPLDFWQQARAALERDKPDLFMLIEGDDPAYLNDAFEMSYAFAWQNALHRVFLEDAPAAQLRDAWLETRDLYPQGCLFMRNYENHDIANDSYDRRIETRLGAARVEAALALCFLIDGVPLLYNGCEVGDEARHSIFANREFGAGMTIQWERAITKPGKERYAFLQALCALKHGRTALAQGQTRWLDHDAPTAVAAFVRETDKEKVLCVVNPTAEDVTVTLDAPIDALAPLLTRRAQAQIANGKLELHLGEGGIYIAG